jgi:hypothetical protein
MLLALLIQKTHRLAAAVEEHGLDNRQALQVTGTTTHF